MRQHPSGMTLIETVIYIGILAIILPSLVILLISVIQKVTRADARIRIAQTITALQTQLNYELLSALSINTSASVLGVNPSTLRFTSQSGELITLDRQAITVTFGNTQQTVNRLRWQRGIAAALWFTDPNLNVFLLRVDPIRDGINTLRGLRINIGIELVNTSITQERSATWSSSTTISLSPSTTEN